MYIAFDLLMCDNKYRQCDRDVFVSHPVAI